MVDDPAGIEALQARAVQAQFQASQELEVRRCLSALELARNDHLSYAECLRRLQGACQIALDKLEQGG